PGGEIAPGGAPWYNAAMRRERKIRLIVVDIDGCITPGESEPADLGALARIREFNRLAESDPDVPHVTLCTGRQQPYVELMCQLIGAVKPAVFESGSGLYLPATYEFLPHPSITPERKKLVRKIHDLLHERFEAAGTGKIQPGKEFSFSVYPAPGHTVGETGSIARDVRDANRLDVAVEEGIRCVTIYFSDINKGEGVRFLARREGLVLEEIGGVGDAPGDLPYLEIVGFSAAPANAHESVRARASFVSASENGAGTVEIIEYCIERNRKTDGRGG
ncbi:MAG: HAD hydrolase family protein, partial [bacterium]